MLSYEAGTAPTSSLSNVLVSQHFEKKLKNIEFVRVTRRLIFLTISYKMFEIEQVAKYGKRQSIFFTRFLHPTKYGIFTCMCLGWLLNLIHGRITTT